VSVYDKVVVNSPRDFAPVQRVAVPGICPSLRHVFSCRGRGCVGGGCEGGAGRLNIVRQCRICFPCLWRTGVRTQKCRTYCCWSDLQVIIDVM